MDVIEVRARVSEVDRLSTDEAMAHYLESDLFSSVLTAIAAGTVNPRELATEALATCDIAFLRLFGERSYL